MPIRHLPASVPVEASGLECLQARRAEGVLTLTPAQVRLAFGWRVGGTNAIEYSQSRCFCNFRFERVEGSLKRKQTG